MKKLSYYMSFMAILALLFTSCSKEENDVSGLDGQDTFQLQLNANLNDFNKQQKDHLSDDPVECSTDAPAYVLVALTDSGDNWVAGMNPEADGADVNDFIKVMLKDNNGSWETEFSEDLGLPAGTYQLEYFIVYTAADEVLWVAPREGGAYASSVGDPLPQEIILGAGTKPYINVDVLCYVPRVEDAFGYVFFDINPIPVINNYCFFVNFCDDETGREYPANFQVDIWADGYDGSEVVKAGEMNSVSGTGNDFAATVLCVALPELVGDDTYFVRVTVLSAGAYTADGSDFVEFEIDQADIEAQLLATPRYEHLRINCDTPPDDCPLTPEQDPDGDCKPDNDCTVCDNCPGISNPDQEDADDDGAGDACDICPGFDDNVDTDGDGVPDGCDVCASGDDDEDTDGDGVPNACDICAGGDDYIDTDGDGTPDYCDDDYTDLKNCETAFMVGNRTLISLDLGDKRWGWAEYFEGENGVYVHDVYAGAGQNDLSKGTLVGQVTLTVSAGNVAVKYMVNSGVINNVTHIYFSDDNAPTTTAPGQYGNTDNADYTGSKTWNFNYSNDGDFWIIVHSEVCPLAD
jgi:hypothetical protein